MVARRKRKPKAPDKKVTVETVEPETKKTKKEPGKLTLAQVRAKIRKRYEKPTVIFEDDEDSTPIVETRFSRLNLLLGGGLRCGSIIEMFGFEDSGKSSLSIAMAADIQKVAPEGKKHVVLVNYEGPQPWKWWRTLGLDTSKDNFTQLRPSDLEEGMGDAKKLCETGEVCCLIIDSVYAAAARARGKMMENWSDKSKSGVALGVEAVKWGEAWTSLKGIFQEHEIIAIAVNQMREVIDTKPGKKSFVKPTTTPRGHALKFYAWVRMEIRGGWLSEECAAEDGRMVKIRIIKNKTSEDARGRCNYDLVRGVGFDLVGDLIELGKMSGLIEHKGAGFYILFDENIRGKEKLRAFIEGNPKIKKKLEQSVKKFLSKDDVNKPEDEDEEA